MAIMNCPECGEKVSTQAEICPHCGYPIYKELLNQYEFKGRTYDITPVIEELDKGNTTMAEVEIANMFRLARDMEDISKAADEHEMITLQIFDKYRKCKGFIPGEREKEEKRQQNVAKCPTCGSTNIEVIGAGTRLMAGAMFGLASKTSRSQFKCKNCGYQW